MMRYFKAPVTVAKYFTSGSQRRKVEGDRRREEHLNTLATKYNFKISAWVAQALHQNLGGVCQSMVRSWFESESHNTRDAFTPILQNHLFTGFVHDQQEYSARQSNLSQAAETHFQNFTQHQAHRQERDAVYQQFTSSLNSQTATAAQMAELEGWTTELNRSRDDAAELRRQVENTASQATNEWGDFLPTCVIDSKKIRNFPGLWAAIYTKISQHIANPFPSRCLLGLSIKPKDSNGGHAIGIKCVTDGNGGEEYHFLDPNTGEFQKIYDFHNFFAEYMNTYYSNYIFGTFSLNIGIVPPASSPALSPMDQANAAYQVTPPVMSPVSQPVSPV